MATQTTNLHLVKPDYTDAADVAVINSNMDTIDSNVHGNAVDIAGIATIITGTTNNSGHSISSGEYFIANGAKYKATAAIGTGVTWADKSSSVSDHDLINALNSNITNIFKFTFIGSVADLADFQSKVDNLIPSTGFTTLALTDTNSNKAGLATAYHYGFVLSASNNKIVVLFRLNGSEIKIASKASGTWNNSWKTYSAT